MKKLLSFTLLLVLCVTLIGCGNDKANSNSDILDLTENTEQTVTETLSETVVAETIGQNATSITLPEGAISSDEAIDIALKKAGLNSSQVIGLWAELDYENGVLIYEVDFSDGTYDYDCDVDANNGKVLAFDKELDD